MSDYKMSFMAFVTEFFPEDVDKISPFHLEVINKFMEHIEEKKFIVIIGGNRYDTRKMGLTLGLMCHETAATMAKEFMEMQTALHKSARTIACIELENAFLKGRNDMEKLSEKLKDLDIPQLKQEYLPDNDVPGNKTNSLITHPHKKDYFLEQRRLQYKHARRRK